jgi:hypothetical protein
VLREAVVLPTEGGQYPKSTTNNIPAFAGKNTIKTGIAKANKIFLTLYKINRKHGNN